MFPKELIDGYHAFLDECSKEEQRRYKFLSVYGQNPDIMVISCSDSRVAPEIIFNAMPGEIFVVRNIANLVPPNEHERVNTSYHGTSAAIEYAVNALNVKHIVVLGHSTCGGVAAYADHTEPLSKKDFIGKWMSQIEPVAKRMGPKPDQDPSRQWIRKFEFEVVKYSLDNLLTFPIVKDKVDKGELKLYGAYFSVFTGVLFVLNPETGEFIACPNT